MRIASLLAGALAALGAGLALAQTPAITADGSSTVYPITVEAARRSGMQVDVAFSGTTAGFRRFCAGEIDIGNASRPISREEMARCAEAGVSYVELPIAFDALAVVVNAQNDWARDITLDELRRLWEPAAENTVKTWSQVRAGWPDRPIVLYGRGQDSGTYEYFTTAVVGQARASRRDYFVSEDEEILAAGIAREPGALGFFGVGAFFRHWEELRDVGIDAGEGPVHPAMRAVLAGRYRPLGRPLFIYVNAGRLAERPALARFVEAYVRGLPQWVHFTGYLPLSADAYGRVRERLVGRTTGTRFDGQLQIGTSIDDL